jgi:DnaK suppressor protein
MYLLRQGYTRVPTIESPISGIAIIPKKRHDECAMKKTTSSRILRLQMLLLHKQDEVTRGLRNHRLVDALAATEPFDGVEQRDVDLLRFSTDADVLTEIRSALDRVSDGTFGVCEECGKSIPAKRLEALPWARYCVSCQEHLENRAREMADEPKATFSQPSQRRAAA